jgi:hypothetical protein
MKTNISEDLPARKFAPAANTGGGSAVGGGGDMEKKARAAIHDSKYRVKKDMGPDTKLDPAAFIEAVIEKLRNSQYDLTIKTRAIQILRGDGQKKEIKEFASHNVARALYSVFVEKPSKIIDEEYIEKLKEELSKEYQNPEQRKYTYRVTDKLTGNSYITKKTRSEANKLRVNPNISSVEMVDRREGDQRQESERTKGAQTASVAAGKGLKNNDGNLANNYPPYNAVSRGDIIAGATGKDQMGGKKKVREEFIGEKDNGDEKKQIKPMTGTNNYIVHGPSGPSGPSGTPKKYFKDFGGLMAHNELEGEVIAETGYTKFLKIVSSDKDKILNPTKVDMNGPQVGCDGPDPRSRNTSDNLVKNKLRLMGLKMSYEPEGDVIDELTKYAEKTGKKFTTLRKSVTGGNPEVAARNKLPGYNYGGSRQEPKDRGKKPPSPSDEAKKKGVLSPLEHKAALIRNSKGKAKDFRMDTKRT